MLAFLRRALVLVAGFAFVSSNALAAWSYEENADKMDKSVWRYASVDSSDVVKMSFPYKDHRPRLIVRTHGGKDLSLLLQFSGQANRESVHGGRMRVKFDEGAPMNWTYAMPSDAGMAGVIFINNERAFLDRALKAKKVTLELEYFSHGKEVFGFDVTGLDVKKLGLAK